MFQFLQPILLLSLTGIAIPVVIHLWNIKPGKTLKIGSISLLSQGSRQSARSLKLTDLLLLFLRCLLLTLLALLISKPVWKQKTGARKEKGWLLLEKESLHEAYTNNKSAIDSLLKAGFEFHYFNAAFKKEDLEKALKITKDTTVSTPISYWSLLSQLNEEIPAALPVYLFTSNKLNRFTGDRPVISFKLHWQTYLPADSISKWPEKAFLTSTDSVRLLTGHSKPAGTYYNQENLSLTSLSNSGYAVDVTNGSLIVSLKDKAQEKEATNKSYVAVDTSTIRITVFTDKYNNDANYVRAAIQSIRSYSKRKIQLYSTNNLKDIPANQDWLFWLSEQTVPASNNAKNIFRYEKGKVQNIDSWITTENKSAVTREAVSINKSVANNTSNNFIESIWQDGYGNPILTKEVKNNINLFHFFSRFDPEWNELPWSEQFPRLIFEIIFKEKNKNVSVLNDRRIMDQSQIQPSYITSNSIESKNKLTNIIDLTHILWLASFVVFFIERLISYKTKRGVINV